MDDDFDESGFSYEDLEEMVKDIIGNPDRKALSSYLDGRSFNELLNRKAYNINLYSLSTEGMGLYRRDYRINRKLKRGSIYGQED